ncbi:MAG: hypothetical protein U9Q70_02930 [Chloroflexota bacterium]|nr:hypothetical protein [Chloroflexota bacterium]
MSGREIRPSEPSSPVTWESTLPEESTPPIIEVETRLLPERQLPQKSNLLRQGLEVLSGLAQLAMVWVENREKRLAAQTTNQLTATRDSTLAPNAQPTTIANNFNNTGHGRQGGGGGRRRQRRQAKGRW